MVKSRKEKVIYFVLLILCLICYFATSVTYAGLLFTGLVIYGVVAFVLVCYSGKNSESEFSGKMEGSKGKESPIVLHVENKGVFPIVNGRLDLCAVNKLTGERATIEKNVSLMPKSREKIELSVMPFHCGCIEVSCGGMVVSDPLGLFRRERKAEEETQCYVFPPMAELSIDSDSLDRYNMESYRYSANQKGSDISETFGIKNYAPGDSPKAIHWKLSCKMDELVVRELSHPVENSLMIICDKSMAHGQKLNPDTIDRLTELFVSVSCTAVKKQIHHAIGWYNYETSQFQVFRINNLDDIYNALPGLLSGPYREDPISTVGRYIESDAEKNFSTYLYVSESETAEMDTERLLNYGQVDIYRTETFK